MQSLQWIFYFISISPRNDYQNIPPFQFLTNQRLLSPIIEPFQVFQIFTKLNPNKCKGFDYLPNRILKICSQSLATPFSLHFNSILSSEDYPTAWKTATMISLLKTGSQTVVQNYRPIALLPSLSKVFEKLVHKYICNYLEHHKLLIPNNFGFRKKLSTLNSFVSTCHILYQAYDSNLSRIVFLDMSNAFDRVDHTCFTSKFYSSVLLALLNFLHMMSLSVLKSFL